MNQTLILINIASFRVNYYYTIFIIIVLHFGLFSVIFMLWITLRVDGLPAHEPRLRAQDHLQEQVDDAARARRVRRAAPDEVAHPRRPESAIQARRHQALPRVHDRTPHPLLLEVEFDEIGDLRFIFDDQHAGGHGAAS